MGRGGTNMGFADNGAILLDNPGALVNVQGNGLADLAVDTVIPEVNYTDSKPNDVNSSVRPMPLPELTYIRKSDDGRWAFGIGAFAPAGFSANYQMQNTQFFGPQQYHSLGAMGKILPGLCYRVTDRFSIGATCGLAIGYAELNGPFYAQTGPLAGAPSLLNLHGTGVGVTGGFGLQYQLTPQTTLGLAYTSPTNIAQHGGARVTVLVPGLGPVYSSFNSTTTITWPQSLAAGFKHNLCCCRRIAADVVWYNWADSFNQIGMNFSSPSNPLVPVLAGGSTINSPLPLSWHDSVSLRLGYEWDPTFQDTVRAGYVYHTSPSPGGTLNPYLDGILTHTFSLGYSHKFERASLNLAYQYAFSPTRVVGTSDLLGGDFSNSTMKAQAHFASIGLTIPF
jgi:long-subunit fatty acid transport protein